MDLRHGMRDRSLGGLLVQIIDNPAVMLAAHDAGIDFVLFDCEHGCVPYRKLHDLMVLGNAVGEPSVVRVGQLARVDVSRILDFGAAGVMVPMTETADEAELLVKWSKYPPLGQRSYSGGAHTGYGPSGAHEANMAGANARVLSIAQIETVRGVENADEILSVDGIDAAIVGPCDLAISLGRPDEVGCDEEMGLIGRVARACHERGKGFGIIGGGALMARCPETVDLMVSAIDTHLLRDALARAAADYESFRHGGGRGTTTGARRTLS